MVSVHETTEPLFSFGLASEETGISRFVFNRFEKRFDEGVVVADPGAAITPLNTCILQELLGFQGHHGRNAIRVGRQIYQISFPLDFAKGFPKEVGSQTGILPFGQHPTDDKAAEQIKDRE